MLSRYKVDDTNKNTINIKSTKGKSTEQYKQELEKCNHNVVEILEEYINARTPILHKYICGHINKVIPSNALKGLGCNICSKKKAVPKWTTEKYKEELMSKNPEIEVLENYNGANTKILHRHKVCGTIWEVIPASVLRGSSCPKCSGRNVTKEEFLKKFKETGASNIKITGEYINLTTKIEGYCNVCENKIFKTPYELLKGVGCKKCADRKNGLKLRKTHKQFVSELNTVNNNIKVLGMYSVANSKIRVQCKICNYI